MVEKTVQSGSATGVRGLHNPGVLALPLVSLMPMLGLWTMHDWIFWFNTTSLRQGVAVDWWNGIYFVMTAAMFAAFLVFRSGRPRTQTFSSLDGAHCALMVACTASVAVAAGFGAPRAWSLANNAVAGLCMAWGYLRWSSVYASLSLRDGLACLALSYIVGSVLKIPLEVVGGVPGALMGALIPLCSFASLRRAERRTVPEPLPPGETLYAKGSYGAVVRVGLCVFTLILLARFDIRFNPVESVWGAAGAAGAAGFSGFPGAAVSGSVVSHVVEVLLALVALVWVFYLDRRLDFPMVWRFAFLFYAVAIVARHFGAVGAEVSDWCQQVGVSLSVMLLWLFLTDVSHHCDWHPYAVFGLGWCAYVGPNWISRLMGCFMPAGVGGPVLDLVVLLLMAVAIVFVLGSSSPDVQRILQDLQPPAERASFETLDLRCERLGAAHGLTDREVEVFKLLAKGRSKAFIAEELMLSENTIRGHSKHIYTKLGIHTRGELQAMLDD